MFFNPFALWLRMWTPILTPYLDRVEKRRVDLQFNSNRTPWKKLTHEQKQERLITDTIEEWMP
jgi:hypothetical protein